MTTLSETEGPAACEASSDQPLAEAGRYATAAAAFERGLVALAMGSPFWLREDAGEHRLLVQREAAEAVREQLSHFERESGAGRPPKLANASATRRESETKWIDGVFLALIWGLVVIASHAAQARWPGFTEAGAMDARGVFERGEWWRAGTALFLHADLGHLVSNLFGGVFLFAAVFSTLGRARGGVALVVASVVANLARGAVHLPGEYHSLGASTALFAGLGLLTGNALGLACAGEGHGRGAGWGARRAWLATLGAGSSLLMLFGAGEGPVDVPAHAAGFLAGCAMGGVLAKMLRRV